MSRRSIIGTARVPEEMPEETHSWETILVALTLVLKLDAQNMTMT
jgi:hypothetical protein